MKIFTTCLKWKWNKIPSNLWVKSHLSRKIIVDHSVVVGASNYIFIMNLTPGFNGLGKQMQDEKHSSLEFGAPYMRCLTVLSISSSSYLHAVIIVAIDIRIVIQLLLFSLSLSLFIPLSHPGSTTILWWNIFVKHRPREYKRRRYF